MLKHIGYSDLTKRYYFLDGGKGKKVDITDDIRQILKHNSPYQLVCPTCKKGELYDKNGYIRCDNKKCEAIFEQQDTID